MSECENERETVCLVCVWGGGGALGETAVGVCSELRDDGDCLVEAQAGRESASGVLGGRRDGYNLPRIKKCDRW